MVKKKPSEINEESLDKVINELLEKVRKMKGPRLVDDIKSLSLIKVIGYIVLVITEFMLMCLFFMSDLVGKTNAAGMQMIVFGALWGVKSISDNIKIVKGKR